MPVNNNTSANSIIHEHVYDVIIVGGGISGLYMARKCLNDGLSVLLLEKDDRFGGRIHTKYNQGPDDDLQYDTGPARVSRHHHRTLALIDEFNIPTGEVKPFRKHRHVNASDGSVILQKDISSDLIQKILTTVDSHPKKYTTKYLQSLPFHSLCDSILGNMDATQLQHMFGYDAEFKYCNAADAIRMFKRDFQEIGTYFTLIDGLSSLIASLEKDIIALIKKSNNNSALLKNIKISHFKYFNSSKVATIYSESVISSKTKSNNFNTYSGRTLIWAIPQKALREINGWTQSQRNLFDAVVPISLHRIFCQFPYDKKTGKSWMSTVDRTTTNDALRQFIPLKSDKAFAQVSYSDSYYADYWNHYLKLGTNTLSKELLIHLHIVFPELANIVAPKYIDAVYWPEGVHMWRPGVNSSDIHKRMQYIGAMGGSKAPIYIIGEAYSMHQCWIEGALETTDEVFSILKKI